VHIQDGTNNATIDKIHDSGTTAAYVYEKKKLSIAGTNPVKASSSTVPTGFILTYFKVCDTVTPENSLNCWMGQTYKFAQTAIFILSLGAIMLAGIFYMTSTGDPKRIGLAKNLLFGAASAILVIVLGRFFLTKVVGVPWPI
jgi:hypothetical protein